MGTCEQPLSHLLWQHVAAVETADFGWCDIPCGALSLRIFLGLVLLYCSLPLFYFNTSFLSVGAKWV